MPGDPATKRSTLLPLLAALALLPACDEPPAYYNPPRVLEAPDGACWGWSCEGGDCGAHYTDRYCPPLVEAAFPECGPGTELGVAWVAGRFFEIYVICFEPGTPGWWAEPHQGRPLLCSQRTDCPQLQPGSWYECAGGMCQNTNLEHYPRDVLRRSGAEALCFGGLPRTETVGWSSAYAPEYVEIYDALDEACPLDPEQPSTEPVCTGELPDYCLKL